MRPTQPRPVFDLSWGPKEGESLKSDQMEENRWRIPINFSNCGLIIVGWFQGRMEVGARALARAVSLPGPTVSPYVIGSTLI